MPLHSFPKSERMVSTKDIEQLFTVPGIQSLAAWPVRAVYRETDKGEEPLMILISVSKRHLHHAVDRNRAKRQMREAYRLNKQILRKPLEHEGRHIHLAFIWMADAPQSSAVVHRSVTRLLSRIAKNL